MIQESGDWTNLTQGDQGNWTGEVETRSEGKLKVRAQLTTDTGVYSGLLIYDVRSIYSYYLYNKFLLYLYDQSTSYSNQNIKCNAYYIFCIIN